MSIPTLCRSFGNQNLTKEKKEATGLVRQHRSRRRTHDIPVSKAKASLPLERRGKPNTIF